MGDRLGNDIEDETNEIEEATKSQQNKFEFTTNFHMETKLKMMP
jgi:hypothetical protein